jgi:ATP synthase protein I
MSALPKPLPGDLGPDGDDEIAYKRWSREEVRALIPPSISPWRVVMVQLLAGLAVAAVVWLVTRGATQVVSSLWGTAAVVVPGALMARGMSRRVVANPGALVFGFLFWELVKIAVTVALLVLAARSVPDLHWLALLITMIVCMKVNWLALLWRRKRVQG